MGPGAEVPYGHLFRNSQTSKAPLEREAQGTSLFMIGCPNIVSRG